jgi:hypothetical protein
VADAAIAAQSWIAFAVSVAGSTSNLDWPSNLKYNMKMTLDATAKAMAVRVFLRQSPKNGSYLVIRYAGT